MARPERPGASGPRPGPGLRDWTEADIWGCCASNGASSPSSVRNPKTSARAAWAAGQQDRFWQLHEQAYLTEGKKNIGAFATYKLIDMGRAAGVKDLGRFREDMASDEASAVVGKDREEGHPLGVTSTPAFLINDVPVLGGQPVDTFKQTIETAAEQTR